jgi:hypothetical protein
MDRVGVEATTSVMPLRHFSRPGTPNSFYTAF